MATTDKSVSIRSMVIFTDDFDLVAFEGVELVEAFASL